MNDQSNCRARYPYLEAELKRQQFIQEIKKEKKLAIKSKKSRMKSKLNENEILSLGLASEKVASSWLNAMPLKRFHFELTKSEFLDGITLPCDWDPVKMPSLCACSENFTVAHVSNVRKDTRTRDIRHNKLRFSFANLLSDVCHDVAIETHHQPLQRETFALKSTKTFDDARLDINANRL